MKYLHTGVDSWFTLGSYITLTSIYEYGQHNYKLKHVTSLCDKGLFSIYLTYRGSEQGCCLSISCSLFPLALSPLSPPVGVSDPFKTLFLYNLTTHSNAKDKSSMLLSGIHLQVQMVPHP